MLQAFGDINQQPSGQSQLQTPQFQQPAQQLPVQQPAQQLLEEQPIQQLLEESKGEMEFSAQQEEQIDQQENISFNTFLQQQQQKPQQQQRFNITQLDQSFKQLGLDTSQLDKSLDELKKLTKNYDQQAFQRQQTKLNITLQNISDNLGVIEQEIMGQSQEESKEESKEDILPRISSQREDLAQVNWDMVSAEQQLQDVLKKIGNITEKIKVTNNDYYKEMLEGLKQQVSDIQQEYQDLLGVKNSLEALMTLQNNLVDEFQAKNQDLQFLAEKLVEFAKNPTLNELFKTQEAFYKSEFGIKLGQQAKNYEKRFAFGEDKRKQIYNMLMTLKTNPQGGKEQEDKIIQDIRTLITVKPNPQPSKQVKKKGK